MLGNVIADGLNLKQSLKLRSLSRVHTNSAEKRQIKIQIEREESHRAGKMLDPHLWNLENVFKFLIVCLCRKWKSLKFKLQRIESQRQGFLTWIN